MENNQWFYSNIHKQLLYMQFCEQPEFCKALAYLLTFKEHQNLNVKPHTFSIELSNADIHIFIIHTVFFQQKEYPGFKKLKNVHFVSFGKELAQMNEFSEMKNEIKFISKNMLMSTVEALTENKLINAITQFKENDGVIYTTVLCAFSVSILISKKSYSRNSSVHTVFYNPKNPLICGFSLK